MFFLSYAFEMYVFTFESAGEMTEIPPIDLLKWDYDNLITILYKRIAITDRL